LIQTKPDSYNTENLAAIEVDGNLDLTIRNWISPLRKAQARLTARISVMAVSKTIILVAGF
jgi:hypothetical protein